jgi:hypothetical protein
MQEAEKSSGDTVHGDNDSRSQKWGVATSNTAMELSKKAEVAGIFFLWICMGVSLIRSARNTVAVCTQ